MMKRLTYLLLCLVIGIGITHAQTRTVTGTVTSAEDGEPVIGATIQVKGTSIGNITGFDGDFSIDVPTNATTLIVSYVGMESQEVAIKDKMTIVLGSSSELLGEVIVVAYGTAKKASFTGSAATVKTEQIEKRQVSNITQALSGAVAGVQTLAANGQPGTSATVRIRGIGSINAGAAPLYVVDGIPFDGDIASLNTSDVESMTVLKDAASAALYGARAANGVIIITTKKGKSGVTKINFEGRVGVNQRATRNYDVLQNPATYTEKAYEALYNGRVYTSGDSPAAANRYANLQLPQNSAGGLGYRIYSVPDGEYVIGMNGKLNPNATLGYSNGDFYFTPDNWSDETFEDKMRQEYNLNISGGGEKVNYYLSLGYLNDNGIINNSGYERITMRAKGEYDVKKWLKVGASVAYANTNSRYPGEQTSTSSSGNAFFLANVIAPVYPMYIRNADGSLMIDNRGQRVYDYGTSDQVDGTFQTNRSFMSISNPVGTLLYDKEAYKADIFSTNWFATATIIDGLKLTARIGLDVNNRRFLSMGNAYYGQSASYGGTAYQSYDRYMGIDMQYLATYNKTFNELHTIDFMVGYDGYRYESENTTASGQNLYNPTIGYVNNAIDNRIGYGSAGAYATAGVISRLNYDYDEKYFASVSFRRDGSSRFHKDNRWGNFWSASAAWVMNKENFLSDISWIELLKVKASFGQQGNDNIGNNYAYLDQFQMTGAEGVFSDGTLYYKGNKDITWETSNAFNVGSDFIFWDGKLAGSVEYFFRQTKDMLYNKPVSPSVGYAAVPMNIGSMRNSGVELDLTSEILKTRDLTWEVNFNATFLKNKIQELHPDLNGELIDGTRIYTEGESMYRMYLVKYAGVDPEDGQALYWAKNEDGSEYTTPNWSLASENKAATEDLLPTVYGGFGTTVNFFGFDASIQLSYQLGGTIYDSGYRNFMHSGNSSYAGQNWHKDILNSWSEDNKTSNIPRVNAQDTYTTSTSDRWMTSSDYLSLNNISIGYTIPKRVLTKAGIEKLRIYVVADNVALISARSGLDPRQSYTSATSSLYSPIRTISGGISLTF